MKNLLLLSLALIGLLSAVPPSRAQDTGRVSPASLPLPLPGEAPMPPDRLRARDPWNLPMTGPWRFRLTHGQIIAGHFAPPPSAMAVGVTASSAQSQNPPQNAFDGSADTRWCADSGAFPQSLKADLGQVRHVTGITLLWETPGGGYQFRVEGSPDGATWTTLLDATGGAGVGDGPLAITPTDARFVRVTVMGSRVGWASLREFQIHYAQGGQDVVWKPQVSDATPAHADDFTRPGFDDRRWDTVPVPSNWEMLGYSLPTYNSVDDTVGLYRRWVTVPASYAGRRVFWHFDGALDGAEVFVNGIKAGYHESGYTAFDVDLTGLVKPGQRNLFAVRVCKTTPSVDCETGDFQCMGGIYRDTSLIAVPMTHVSDLTVRTPLSDGYRDATLQASVQIAGTPGATVAVTGALFRQNGRPTAVRLAGQDRVGADGTATVALSAFVKAPREWTAETPSLYYLVVQLAQAGRPVERVEQRFGFRQVEIRNNVVLWNGRPIKCTGVCRHDFWPTLGFALTDKQWLTDLTMMKAANVNAIRTSHYNHAARFLELCDEKGFYVLDEVPFCWINEKDNDPAFAPALLQRAQETLARDKNRACVLAWSLGNENGVGRNSQPVVTLVQTLDPTRPRFISTAGPWGGLTGQSFEDRHYPSPADVDNYIAHDTGVLPADYSEQPHIFYQKETQDYDPGASDLWSEALGRTWDKIWSAPTILGSFIWEWQNQGIADPNADRTTDFYYGPNALRQENNKGVVTAFRVPKPEYWIVKMVYSPVAIGARTVSPVGGTCAVPLTNHYSFTDLSALTCRWTALRGGTVLRGGISRVACAPMSSATATFPAPAGMTALRLEFDRADGSNVTVANLGVVGAPDPAPPAGLTSGDSLTVQPGAAAVTVGNALHQLTFDSRTGNLLSWRVHGRDLLTGSPTLNLGQGKAGAWKGYFADAQAPVLDGALTSAQGLMDGSARVVVTSTVRAVVGGPSLGTLTCTYDVRPDATVGIAWTLDWTAPDTHLWEVGLGLPVSFRLSQVSWWRDSYFTAYPRGHLGEPMGTCPVGDTLARASKRGLHWLTLTDTTGTGLVLLQDGTPLVGRVQTGAPTDTLLASAEVAGPQGLSGDWVADHDILATAGKPLTGGFLLRATGSAAPAP